MDVRLRRCAGPTVVVYIYFSMGVTSWEGKGRDDFLGARP